MPGRAHSKPRASGSAGGRGEGPPLFEGGRPGWDRGWYRVTETPTGPKLQQTKGVP